MSTFFDNPRRLSVKVIRVMKALAILYILAICIMCFMPQPQLFEGIKTPNIIYVGRLRFLLVPFNSILGLGKVNTLFEGVWIFCQNLMNVFLLLPLVYLCHFLTSKWHGYAKSFLLGLTISFSIEITQLLLDVAINANRVFEIDDLWTNALGASIAYGLFRLTCSSKILT
ncbi:VanZ family protein [Streptococcus uberis]